MRFRTGSSGTAPRATPTTVDDDGEVRSCWESEDEDVVETREQNLGCQSCGVFDGPSIDGDDVRYGA